MAGSGTTTVGNSAEEVECCDDLITEILSRVSTRDLLKMSTVVKRWRNLIFDPFFAHIHSKNCHRESMFFFREKFPVRQEIKGSFQLRYSNLHTGNLSIGPVSWEGLDISLKNDSVDLVTASNGLLCFCTHVDPDPPEFLLYNPVTKFLKKLPLPFDMGKEGMDLPMLIGFCSMQSTGKLVMGGFSFDQEDTYTLVFDSQSNSWHKGPPLFCHIRRSSRRSLFFNGVIYFLVGTESVDAQEGKGPRDVEALFRDEYGLFSMIIGYDVNQDQWCFSIFIPTSVGYPYCLIEWEGNLLVLASNSTHDRNRNVNHVGDEGYGHFVFWILDTELKLWTQERELDLPQEFYISGKVSASGGVVWLTNGGHNSVTVYHMKNRHCSTHRLDDALAWWERKYISCVSFEPTLLSF